MTRRTAHALLGIALLSACGGGFRPFPDRAPMWTDPDRNAFEPGPAEYVSPFAWDAADQTIFRPMSRFFAVDPAGESVNVNAMDEVPDSSWFENRLGHRPYPTAEAVRGACPDSVLDPERGPWTVTDAKPNGANPGFIIEASDGRKWLLKFDGTLQGERATTADVVGSRIYYAAGYYTPCNVIVFFDRDIIRISDDAQAEDEDGEEEPMTDAHLDAIFDKAVRLPDGRYRASGSLFLPGRPLGPWTYQGTREDDPNDVVAHEDRRELRGMYVLASWLNHFDSREQNTLATFIADGDGGRGHVRHNLIDFGDCFGSLWDYEGISRRLGHAYYLDVPYVVEDFVTLGLARRPWDEPRLGPSGRVFGYWSVERFAADEYRAGYPNPAFSRSSERDKAWMARIMAHIDDDMIRAIVRQGRITQDGVEDELLRILRGRLDKILARWFREVSPLSRPELLPDAAGVDVCLSDLAIVGGVEDPAERRYAGRAFVGRDLQPTPVGALRATGDGVCARLPEVPGASSGSPGYLVVDVAGLSARTAGTRPARVHLYHRGGSEYRIVGLERPEDDRRPGD